LPYLGTRKGVQKAIPSQGILNKPFLKKKSFTKRIARTFFRKGFCEAKGFLERKCFLSETRPQPKLVLGFGINFLFQRKFILNFG